MVWGGISYRGKTDLVVVNGNLTGARYLDQIVDPHILPYLRANRPGFQLQQDNARPHVANIVKKIICVKIILMSFLGLPFLMILPL